MPRVFLGSSSASRKDILKRHILGPNDELIISSSDVPEARDVSSFGSARELVLENTRRKTSACLELLSSRHPFGEDDILICGDCVVVTKNGSVYNKPTSVKEALDYLAQYDEDKCLSVTQAVSVTRLSDGENFIDTETCLCEIDGIPKEGREDFLDRSGAMYAAGGIIVEDPYIFPQILGFHGGSIESIMGLSIGLTQRLINKARTPPPPPPF